MCSGAPRVCAGVQLFCGFLILVLGIVWMVLDIEVKDRNPGQPEWSVIVMAAEIIVGFMVMLAGICGLCSSWRWDCGGIFFVAFQVMNAIVWCPLLICGYAFFIAASQMQVTWETYQLDKIMPEITSSDQGYLWLFPISGLVLSAIVWFISLIGACAHCMSGDNKRKYEADTE